MIKAAKRIALCLALCLALTACGGGAGGSEEEVETVVRVGVLAAEGDGDTLSGIRYANSENPAVTIGGTAYTVELVVAADAGVADGGGNGDESEGADADAVKPLTPAEALAAADVSVVLDARGVVEDTLALGRAGIPVIGVLCRDPDATASGDYYFRICFPNSLQGEALASFAAGRLSAKTAYCLGENGSAYDQVMIAAFSRAFEAEDGKVIADLFPPGIEDFSFYLNRAVEEGADVIFMPAAVVYAAQILSQAGTLGVTAPFLGPDALDDGRLPGVVRDSGLRLYVSCAYQAGGSAAFDEGFIEYLTGEEVIPGVTESDVAVPAAAAMGCDAYRVALEAVKRAGSADKADIMAVLPGVSLKGVAGEIAFDDMGDATRGSVYIKAAEKGGWTLVNVRSAG